MKILVNSYCGFVVVGNNPKWNLQRVFESKKRPIKQGTNFCQPLLANAATASKHIG